MSEEEFKSCVIDFTVRLVITAIIFLIAIGLAWIGLAYGPTVLAGAIVAAIVAIYIGLYVFYRNCVRESKKEAV